VSRLDRQVHVVVRDLASVGWQIHRPIQSILGILRMKGREEMGDEEDEGEGGDEEPGCLCGEE
jgi:hypothetical protein